MTNVHILEKESNNTGISIEYVRCISFNHEYCLSVIHRAVKRDFAIGGKIYFIANKSYFYKIFSIDRNTLGSCAICICFYGMMFAEVTFFWKPLRFLQSID